jgi:hypothetical protein
VKNVKKKLDKNEGFLVFFLAKWSKEEKDKRQTDLNTI